MNKTEFKLLFNLGVMHRNLIVKEVISDLISLNDKNMLLSGDDSGLENIWEEICAQVQFEYSIYWDVYLDTLDNCINRSLSKQPKEVIELLLYISNCDIEDEQDYSQENMLIYIKANVLSEADCYKNINITNFLEQ